MPQYSPGQVVGIWAAAALRMAALGWVGSPLLARPIDGAAGIPGTGRVMLMTLGLVWQFALALLLVHREGGALSWSV